MADLEGNVAVVARAAGGQGRSHALMPFGPGLENPSPADIEPRSAAPDGISVGRVEPEDVPGAIRFLISDDTRFITGVTPAVSAVQSAVRP